MNFLQVEKSIKPINNGPDHAAKLYILTRPPMETIVPFLSNKILKVDSGKVRLVTYFSAFHLL